MNESSMITERKTEDDKMDDNENYIEVKIMLGNDTGRVPLSPPTDH